MGKVLVLGSDTRSFLTVVRSLGRRGLVVHVGWCPEDAPARTSRYVSHAHGIPPYDPHSTAWKRGLLDIMAREHYDLVIPCDDPTVIPIHAHRKDVERVGPVALPPEPAFEIASDKLKSYELARALDIPVPKGVTVPTLREEEVGRVTEALSFPVVVKPRSTFRPSDIVNRNSVRTAHTREQLDRLLRAANRAGGAVVQERVPGIGVGVEVLADRGELLVAFQHERVHEPLSGGGSSYRRSVPLRPDLAAATARLIRALDYTGVAMVEFRLNPATGRWVFVEINARFWGSLPLAVAAGADFPYFLYQLLVQHVREFPQRYATGLYARNLWLDAVWMRENFRARRSGTAAPTLSALEVAREGLNVLTRRERVDTLVSDDLRPGLVEIAHLVGSAWGRAKMRLRLRGLKLPFARRRGAERARRALLGAGTVLFVCKGNICRSPFAHALAARILPGPVTVTSQGYYPTEGRAPPPEAIHAARDVGVDLAAHRSQVITHGSLRAVDVIFAFDEADMAVVLARDPSARSKLHLLRALLPRGPLTVRDPYGQEIEAFQTTYRLIAEALESYVRWAQDLGQRPGVQKDARPHPFEGGRSVR